MLNDDLLQYAITIRGSELRLQLWKMVVENCQLGNQLAVPEHSDSEVAIYDWDTALQQNCWACYPALGDAGLSTQEYESARLTRMASEFRCANPSDWVIIDERAIRPVLLACQDVWNRHGVRAVTEFTKECWSARLVFSLDDYFLAVHTALRSEAFGLSWDKANKELSRASNGGGHISGRAARLAKIDKEQGRNAGDLEAVAQREHDWALSVLQEARRQSFAEFLRRIFVCYPMFYTLRDIWWEMHHLTDDKRYESLECLVDEFQADIGQLLVMPHGGPILFSILSWGEKSVRARLRSLRYWKNSRVQINDELYSWASSHLLEFGELPSEALGSLMRSSLSEGQELGLRTFEEFLAHATDREWRNG